MENANLYSYICHMDKKVLTPKQEKFVVKYLEISNAVEAYKCAYNASKMNANSIKRTAFETLRHPKIAAEIEKRMKITAQGSEISKLRVLEELENILDAKISDYVEFDGKKLKFKDFDKLTEKQLKAIESIKETKHGIELKLHGKSWTIERICKMLGYDAPVKQDVKLDEDTVKLIVGMKVQ